MGTDVGAAVRALMCTNVGTNSGTSSVEVAITRLQWWLALLPLHSAVPAAGRPLGSGAALFIVAQQLAVTISVPPRPDIAPAS